MLVLTPAGCICRKRGVRLLLRGRGLPGRPAASLAGLLVGCRRCGCRGDYLAIVTLGFGEIIRVIILNIESMGGARGLRTSPAPAPSTSF